MQDNNFPNLHMVFEKYFQSDALRPFHLGTGLPALDHVLGGGLFPGLIVLGGMPGIGKSTLSIQIAAHVAESGHPVLYFSLEMPDIQLMAKAITQKIYKDVTRNHMPPTLCITAENLLHHSLSAEQLKEVATIMQTRFLENLYICTDPLPVSSILEHVRVFSNQGKRPLVIVDYLQLLPQEKGFQSDKQAVDYNIYEFKKLANGLYNEPSGQQEGLPVLLLSSLNRNAYSNSYAYAGRNSGSGANGSIQIGSFKETGGIEYAADLLLGLQFGTAGKKAVDLLSEMGKPIRTLELAILKNRYGRSGGKIPLQYDPAHHCFFPPSNGAQDSSASKVYDETHENMQPSKTQPVSFEPMGARAEIKGVLNNTKIAGEIRKGACGDRSCQVFGNTYASYSLSEPLCSFDCCVADAIYTLVQEQKKLSLRAILQVLLGSKAANLTPEKRKQLEDSMQRLRTIQFKLDCTQELRTRGDGQADWCYTGPFLRLDNPDNHGVYHLSPDMDEKGILPLYTYGARIRQMITVPSILLDVKDSAGRSMSNTQDNICLKWFLIRRLEVIRHGNSKAKKVHEQMRTISFDPTGSLLKEIRPAEPVTGQAASQRIGRLQKATEFILNYYQRIGYISKVEQYKPNGKNRPVAFRIVDKITKDPKKIQEELQ